MHVETGPTVFALQTFIPEPATAYPIDVAARLAQVPRHLVLVYCRHGLIEPKQDPEYGGYYFDVADIRLLQRIAHLHQECGVNLPGIRIILQLMDEVAYLRFASVYKSFESVNDFADEIAGLMAASADHELRQATAHATDNTPSETNN